MFRVEGSWFRAVEGLVLELRVEGLGPFLVEFRIVQRCTLNPRA